MTYAVDFDKTLSFAPYPDVGNPNTPLIEYLIRCRENGDKVILWSCREGEYLNRAINFCKSQGLEFDAVNDNLPELVAIFKSNPRKIAADIYIDDKAIQADVFVKNRCGKRKGVRGLKIKK